MYLLARKPIQSTALTRTLFLVIALFTSEYAFAFGLPDGQLVFPRYESIARPIINSNPVLAKPIAVSSDGSGKVTLQVQSETNGVEVDLYFGISAPAIAPDTLFLLNEASKITSAEGGLVPWKRSVTSVQQEVILDIPVAQLAKGTYTLYLLMTGKDQTNPLAANYYLWSTHLNIVEDLSVYVAPGTYGSYPAAQNTVQGWIDILDTKAIRAHSWDIWASITADAGNNDLPIWETWFTGHEIFDLEPKLAAADVQRGIEQPKQFHHAQLLAGHDIPIDLPESLTSFNRYTKTLADYIVDHQYNELSTLQAINDEFNAQGTAVIDRQILTSDAQVDSSQIVLKPVFQFISATEPTVIPYWAGIAPAYTTNLSNPEPKTWRQGVVVAMAFA